MSVNINNNEQQQAVIAQIQQLVKELNKCAPHPDRPDQNGPLFLQKDANHQLPSENDGMLGSMLMDGMLGSAFTSVANDTASEWVNSFQNAVECTSEYAQDRSGNNHYQIGQRRVIAGNFNNIGSRGPEYTAMMNAYQADLPRRLSLEKWISHETRRLYALRKNAPMPMPSMAA